MQATHTVSGPGIDKRVESAALGLSAATTFANRAAIKHEAATYYVRDEHGVGTGRAESYEDGSVSTYGRAA